MYWFVNTIVIISLLLFSSLSEAKLGEKLPSAVIVGTVYCDTCFQSELSKPTHFIAGALVGVECKGTRTNPSFHKEVKTNANGEFRIHLPFSISKHVKKIQDCSVKLISSNEPYCAIASTATSSNLHLKSKTRKTHIFSAGYFTFKPHNQPSLCNQKPTKIFNSRKSLPQVPNNTGPLLPPPVQNPIIPILPPTDQNFLPPLPTLPRLPPLPQLPPLPTLPGLPLFPPSDKKLKSEKVFQKSGISENSFRPPPLNFPPNPFLSPPSISIPNVPNLKPSPVQPLPTPTTPVLSNPLPPFPFQPSQGFPGNPPASSFNKKSP